MGSPYTPEVAAFIRGIYATMPNKEIERRLREEMGVTLKPHSLGSWACAHGLKKQSNKVDWDDEHTEFFRFIVPGHTEREISELWEARYGMPLTTGQIGNRKTLLGIRSGTHGGQFVKGQPCWCKGMTWDEQGRSPESQAASRATTYKKGQNPDNAVPVGTERITKDGYIEVKVRELRESRANDQWIMKHRMVWEEANGREVPKGHNVTFIDHDKTNLDPSNLALVSKGEWAQLRKLGLPYNDRESFEAALAVVKLRIARVDAMMRAPRVCGVCGQSFVPDQDKRYNSRAKTCPACLAQGRKKTKPKGHRHDNNGKNI